MSQPAWSKLQSLWCKISFYFFYPLATYFFTAYVWVKKNPPPLFSHIFSFSPSVSFSLRRGRCKKEGCLCLYFLCNVVPEISHLKFSLGKTNCEKRLSAMHFFAEAQIVWRWKFLKLLSTKDLLFTYVGQCSVTTLAELLVVLSRSKKPTTKKLFPVVSNTAADRREEKGQNSKIALISFS